MSVTNDDLYHRMKADERRLRAGVTAAVCGIIFGILGIFTIGAVFVPLAALLTALSLLSALLARNLRGIVLAFTSGVITAFAFIVSPTAWLLLAAFLSKQGHPAP